MGCLMAPMGCFIAPMRKGHALLSKNTVLGRGKYRKNRLDQGLAKGLPREPAEETSNMICPTRPTHDHTVFALAAARLAGSSLSPHLVCYSPKNAAVQ
jgi:hypothetical protein